MLKLLKYKKSKTNFNPRDTHELMYPLMSQKMSCRRQPLCMQQSLHTHSQQEEQTCRKTRVIKMTLTRQIVFCSCHQTFKNDVGPALKCYDDH